jgi:hypothetical protein
MALTLTITDLGNGSGLYDVAGSTGTTLIYHMPYGETEWSHYDTVTEDTNGEIDAETGSAWWYAIDDAGIPTAPIAARITNSEDSPHETALVASKELIQTIGLTGISSANIVAKIFPDLKSFQQDGSLPSKLPAIILACFANETMNPMQGTDQRDDIGYPVTVVIVQAKEQANLDDQRAEQLAWRHTIIKAFRNQKLPGTDSFKCVVEPQSVFNFQAYDQNNLLYSAFTLRFFFREARGL